MCLVKKHRFPKIAWKPIKVYKYVNPYNNNIEFETPYMHKSYKFGEIIKAKCSWIKTFFKNEVNGEGVHAYPRPMLASHLATIPKFSLYWKGKYGDIASTKLIVHNKKFIK